MSKKVLLFLILNSLIALGGSYYLHLEGKEYSALLNHSSSKLEASDSIESWDSLKEGGLRYYHSDQECSDMLECLDSFSAFNRLSLNEYASNSSHSLQLNVSGRDQSLFALLGQIEVYSSPLSIQKMHYRYSPEESQINLTLKSRLLPDSTRGVEPTSLKPFSFYEDKIHSFSEALPAPSLRNLYRVYPPENEEVERVEESLAPQYIRVERSPDWLVFSGKEKRNGRLCYLFIDERTGRVRKLIPGESVQGWFLEKKEASWFLTIMDQHYILESFNE